MSNKEKLLFNTLQKYYDEITKQGFNVYAIMLKGSQNYNLDDEESDIDANAIIIPSDLQMLRTGFKQKFEFSTGEVTCHDIYSFAEIVAKGNPQWIEVCNTSYKIGKDLSMFSNYKLNPSALKGMIMEKVVAFDKLYPSREKYVKQFGYDPKQLHHIIRLYDCLKNNTSNYQYFNEERIKMLDIKRGRLPNSKDEAFLLRDSYLKLLNDIYEEKKLRYQPQAVDYQQLDKIVLKEFCNATTSSK